MVDFADERTDVRFRLRQGTSDIWAARNTVLMKGEPGLATDTGEFKIGNGVTPWNDLPSYVDEDGIADLLAEIVGETGSVTMVEFLAHIDAAEPHPAYDNGADFVLLYENAKV